MTTPATIGQLQRARQARDYRLLLAVCTVCAATRSAKRPRNTDWCDRTGDLKCGGCDAITRHALITGSSDDERQLALAYGMPDAYGNTSSHDIMDRARAGMKRNPRLEHIWYISVEKKAIAERAPYMRTLCGGLVPTPKSAEDTASVPQTTLDPIAYGESRRMRYGEVDADGWRILQCVDCLRVHNHQESVRRRKLLAELMTTALADLLKAPTTDIYDSRSEVLIELLQAAQGDNG